MVCGMQISAVWCLFPSACVITKDGLSDFIIMACITDFIFSKYDLYLLGEALCLPFWYPTCLWEWPYRTNFNFFEGVRSRILD